MRRLSQNPRDPAFVQDPYPFYDRARAQGPLFLWEEYGYPCAAGYDAVSALLRDRRFGREPPEGMRPTRPAHLAHFYAIDDLSLLDREPPAHTRLRGLVLRAFTSRRIAALRPEIATLANDLIDRLQGPETDLLASFAERLPVVIIARLLGVPEDMADQFLAWSHAMVAMYQARRDRAVEDAADAAARDFAACLRARVETRRAAPADDLVSSLIAAEADGERLTPDELIATCVLLLNAGHEATVHAIGNGVRAILTLGLDPGRLFADPAATERSVEEILRFDPPLHLFTRIARENVEICGHRFAPGDVVGCLLAAANRDPARFPDPGRFDPDRSGPAQLAFGAGIHFCVGAPLARLELAVALPTLFARLPGLALARPPTFADRYHFHGLERLDVTIGDPPPDHEIAIALQWRLRE
ncbi:cytochrome P450 [Amaricoccus sp.]|uniref:cytochrome P450 n=1 Tax=Amaricoccus sp. TaxID=1872485 RepID=UPI001B6D7D63|nr:cytochrome P450 [Amaricoccus sp.]MBP7241063.1 cytochrome P450 [Amaricoccus sp.]